VSHYLGLLAWCERRPAAADPEMGRYLDAHVRTGATCSFDPEHGFPGQRVVEV
jgi:hypothetical protein